METDPRDQFELVTSYSADQAVEDGVLIDLGGAPAPAAEPEILPLDQINGIDDYLRSYGKILGKKAITALDPIHVPNRDPLPDFSDLVRPPFDPQKHAITAAVGMLDEVGSGFVVGEMGTGKTLMGITAIFLHGRRSRKKGGYGGKFRCLVLCPDHLISKWCREIEQTIPGAIITRFGPLPAEDDPEAKGAKGKRKEREEAGSRLTLRDFVDLFRLSNGKRWKKPRGPEYYVLGRNQAKWMSDWSGLADVPDKVDHRPLPPDPWRDYPFKLGTTPQAKRQHAISSRHVVVDKVPDTDESGRPRCNRFGTPIMKSLTARLHFCPKCGTIAKNKRGVPFSDKDMSVKGKASTQKKCLGRYAVQVVDPDRRGESGRDILTAGCGVSFTEKAPGTEFNLNGKRWVVVDCGEPLYNYTSRPYRWAPARIIQKKLKRLFSYLIVDEVHEHKSDESAQSMAAGKLMASVDHVLALTGTIIGGYANHLYPLMMRLNPDTLRAEGFEWGKDLSFSEIYGRIDRIVTTREEGGGAAAVGGNVKSMRRARSGNSTERKAVRPGVMPTMFGNHLLGNSIFITLEEMATELPELFEYIGGGPGPEPVRKDYDPGEKGDAKFEDDLWRHREMMNGFFDTAVAMEPSQKAEYDRVTAVLEAANKDLLRRGSMKLLGTYLWTTMDYPDRPYGWGHDAEFTRAFEEYKKEVEAEHGPEAVAKLKMPHTVGYWEESGNKHPTNWRGVVTPKDCDPEVIYPKEQRLIDICKKQMADGRQTWVYVQMTGKRNIQPRLKKLLEDAGLKVGVLRAGDVDPKEREDWIAAHGREFDVMISHPQLVSTGLDLFDKRPGRHNYSTIVFYETGYNLFTMRQAARRSWRIGQKLDCRVYYLYYTETMQHKAMGLMSKKMAASQALEGEFSEEGLAAMAGDDNLQMSLAKAVAERIDSSDMQRSWTKVKGGGRKVRQATDDLPVPLAMIVEGLTEDKPVPESAKDDIAALADRLEAVDLAFKLVVAAEDGVEYASPDPDDAAAEEVGPAADSDPEAEPEPDPLEVTRGRVVAMIERIIEVNTAPEPEPVVLSFPNGSKMEFALPEQPAPAVEPEPEPAKAPTVDELPPLSPEILAKMFANAMSHGLLDHLK